MYIHHMKAMGLRGHDVLFLTNRRLVLKQHLIPEDRAQYSSETSVSINKTIWSYSSEIKTLAMRLSDNSTHHALHPMG
jgi:hypothetical protein